MTVPAHLDPAVRHDAVVLFDVTDGNPNGDPDAANQPRLDDETGQGIVTDVAIKRKIRNVVPHMRQGHDRFGIFVEAGHALNTRIDEGMKANDKDPYAAQAWLCNRYFDIRMFGAVLSTGEKSSDSRVRGAGQVYGPTQLTFARSIDAINPVEHTVTRITQTTEKDLDLGKVTAMGRKWTTPYGLYVTNLHYSATRAAKTGVTSDDLAVLWDAITMMFEHDRSAARGEMKLCGLHVFSHPNALGVAPAHRLTSRIQLQSLDSEKPPRSHQDYACAVDVTDLPEGVTHTAVENVWP